MRLRARSLLLSMVLLAVTRPIAAGPAPVCQPGETALVVRVQAHTLALCADGRMVGNHSVALGSGGVGKRRTGDLKTPLGRYPLGPPRGSQRFGTFVPVGYPTASQQRLGFTGYAVGIHGPPRDTQFAGVLNTLVDWTAGCIAVGSDEAIQAVAGFIRDQRVKHVRIE